MRKPKRFLEVQFDVSGSCNLRCRMCYLTYQKRSPIFIEPEDFRHIADEVFPHTRTLVLSWATEPLLHPRFEELLSITSEYGVPEVLFVTNGTLLNPTISEALVEKRISKVVVSMEGADAETYEEIRRGASFDELLENLASFAEIRTSRGSQLPKLQFNYLLMRSTVGQLPDFVKLAARFQPSEINAWFMDLQAGAPVEKERIDASDPHFQAMVPMARAAARREGITLYLPYVPLAKGSRLRSGFRRVRWSSAKIIKKLRHRSRRASWLWLRTMAAVWLRQRRSLCWEPATRLVIWPDGAVQPCCRWGPEPLGALNGKTFSEVWDSEAWVRLREALRTGEEIPEICRDCFRATSRLVF